MADTGIRYPNQSRAEVHVTKDDDSSSETYRCYGWRCEGCQDASPDYMKSTIGEARADAQKHADGCTALPPKTAPVSNLLPTNIDGVEVLLETVPE